MFRLKTCEVMQYFKYYDTMDVNIIIDRINTLTNLKSYCGIVHDKDIKEDGTLKEPHFHIVLTFRDTTTSSIVASALHIEEQYVNKIKTSTKSAELYLIHKNDLEKYQYDVHDVFSNFDYVEKYDSVKPLPNISNIAEKIKSGEVKAYNITSFIDINTYAKHKLYFDRCFEYRIKNFLGVDRDMECVFISGGSGVGKTSFAKMYASRLGYATYISSGGKNPLDNYEGQECIILDDLRDSTYKLSDFLKLTDNNTDSLVGCRFYNKSINECKLLIVTSVKPIEEFYFNIAQEEKEPQKQLFRRFKTYIKMKNDVVFFYSYNEDMQEYTKLCKVVNPIQAMFNKDVASKLATDIINTMQLEIFNEKDTQTNLDLS